MISRDKLDGATRKLVTWYDGWLKGLYEKIFPYLIILALLSTFPSFVRHGLGYIIPFLILLIGLNYAVEMLRKTFPEMELENKDLIVLNNRIDNIEKRLRDLKRCKK